MSSSVATDLYFVNISFNYRVSLQESSIRVGNTGECGTSDFETAVVVGSGGRVVEVNLRAGFRHRARQAGAARISLGSDYDHDLSVICNQRVDTI